jgi:hypothetical protein
VNIVERHQRARRQFLLVRLRPLRTKWLKEGGRGYPLSPAFYFDWKKRFDVPERPTAERLLDETRRLFELCSHPLPHNPYDSEYYSACGYDDYLCDQRRERRELACELARAALELGGEWDAFVEQQVILWEPEGVEG